MTLRDLNPATEKKKKKSRSHLLLAETSVVKRSMYFYQHYLTVLLSSKLGRRKVSNLMKIEFYSASIMSSRNTTNITGTGLPFPTLLLF